LNRRPQPRKEFIETSSRFLSLPATQINWEEFKAWLSGRFEVRTAQRRLRYAEKFHHCLLNRNFAELQLLNNNKRSHILKALSALAKFLGIYDDFKALVRNYGIKWAGTLPEDLMIKRLTRVADHDDMARWVQSFKEALPDLSLFIDFQVSTGLRFEEAIEANNLIIKLGGQGRLNEYYSNEKQALEHFRFRQVFIRRSKKAFVSFVAPELINKIAAEGKEVNRNIIHCRLKRRKMRAKFSDLREYYASFMTKYLRESEIDFLQGRISASVFMRNYFNPAWLSDLKHRALQGAQELLKSLIIA
jgi:intergrase/recombinase